MSAQRETFASRFGSLMVIIGVAIGLGNIWRFPYMVGKFGGAAFVLFYTVVSVVIGIPALMAEFALGRQTRRGPVGAFAAGGFPFGKAVGWFFFGVITAATGYYAAVIGWVMYYAGAQLAQLVGLGFDPSKILPPDHGLNLTSFLLQLACTGIVIAGCVIVVINGVRAGIERASKWIMPVMFTVLIVLTIRTLTLPGAMKGVEWYILKFQVSDLTANVMMAALGHMIFSLSLGGTFMVVYGSYLRAEDNVASPAIWTVVGDTGSSLIAGFAIIPAVIALGLEPSSGPGLIFNTIPKVFAAMPGGAIFGFLFFVGLLGAGFLSDIGAVEVLVAGITDNSTLTRKQAGWIAGISTFVLAIPPMINNAIFVPWDLTFGSGMQTLGALLAALTIGWCMHRSTALKELSLDGTNPVPAWLFAWIRYGIPVIILSVGVYWLLTAVFGTIASV